LWKPITNDSGTAAFRFDATIAREARSVAIIAPDGNTIKTGRFTSFGEDGARGKYEFSKVGSAYPNESPIVITLQNGEKITIPIVDTAKRVEKK
jgi:hypothetical protein